MDGPVIDAELRLDAPVVVNGDHAAIAAALRACPQGGIEGKQSGPRLHQRMPVPAEFHGGQPDAVHAGNHMGHAATQAHGRFQRFQPALPLVFRQPHAVLNHQQRSPVFQGPFLVLQPEGLSMRKGAQIPLRHQVPFQRGQVQGNSSCSFSSMEPGVSGLISRPVSGSIPTARRAKTNFQ